MDIEEFFTAKVGIFGLETDSYLKVGTVLKLITEGNVSISGTIEEQHIFITSLLADVKIKSERKTQGKFNSNAGGSSTFYAPTIEAKSGNIASKGDTIFMDVTDVHEQECNLSSRKKQWHGGSKKKLSQSVMQRLQSRGAKFKIEQDLKISGKNVTVCNVNSTARHNILSAPKGKVSILQGENRFTSGKSSSSSDVFWRSSSFRSTKEKTYSSSIFTGTIEIDSQSAIIEVVSGRVLSFLQQIIKQPENLTFVALQEEYSSNCYSSEGPGVGLVALAALTVAIVTSGAASQLSASLLGIEAGATAGTAGALATGSALSVAHTALAAGFTHIFSQAAASIVANGDFSKVIKDLSSKDNVKQLAITMISAGVMDKVGAQLKLSTKLMKKTHAQRAAYYGSKGIIDASLKVGITGQKLDKAILSGLQDAAISIAVASVGSKMDNLLEKREISRVGHTVMQAAVGATKSIILGDPNGPLIGAIGAIISASLNNKDKDKDKDKNKDKDKDKSKDLDKDKYKARVFDKYKIIFAAKKPVAKVVQDADDKNVATSSTSTRNSNTLKKTMNAFLSFPLDLLFGQQAYADEVSSSKLRADTSRLSPAAHLSALDQVQSFPAKFISNNDLAISPKQRQQLQSNPSWMDSILSFPTDLLFGQMAYADGVPQSSDGASSSSGKKPLYTTIFHTHCN